MHHVIIDDLQYFLPLFRICHTPLKHHRNYCTCSTICPNHVVFCFPLPRIFHNFYIVRNYWPSNIPSYPSFHVLLYTFFYNICCIYEFAYNF